MRQRGRKGVTQIEASGAPTVISRPDAPLDLTPDASDEWRAIVDVMPSDWFSRETWPLLAQYCRHAVTSRRVGQLIEAEMAAVEIDLQKLNKLTKMQAQETSSLKAMAAAMRLAQQSTWNAKSGDTAKSKREVKRLWDG